MACALQVPFGRAPDPQPYRGNGRSGRGSTVARENRTAESFTGACKAVSGTVTCGAKGATGSAAPLTRVSDRARLMPIVWFGGACLVSGRGPKGPSNERAAEPRSVTGGPSRLHPGSWRGGRPPQPAGQDQ